MSGWGKDYKGKKGGWSSGGGNWQGDGGKGSQKGNSKGKAGWSSGGGNWYGGKGKQSNWWSEDAQGQEEDNSWNAGPGGKAAEYTHRIQKQYQFPNAMLRSSADATGSSLVKYDNKKANDRDLLSKHKLHAALSASNSHIIRRPGVGISEAAGSIQHGMAACAATYGSTGNATNGIVELFDLVNNDSELAYALQILDTTSGEHHKGEEYATAVGTLFKFLTKSNDSVLDNAAKVAIFASRMYTMAMAFLQLAPMLADPALWAQQVPGANSDHPSMAQWKANPEDIAKMSRAIAAMIWFAVRDRHSTASGSNDATNVFGGTSTGSASPFADDGLGQQAPQRVEKHANKDKHKKKSKKSSSSSSSSTSSSTKRRRVQKKKDKEAKKKDKEDKDKEAMRKDKEGKKPVEDKKDKKDKEDKKPVEDKKDKKDKKDKNRSRTRSKSRSSSHGSQKRQATEEKLVSLTAWNNGRAEDMETQCMTWIEAMNGGGAVPELQEVQALLSSMPHTVAVAFDCTDVLTDAATWTTVERTALDSALNKLKTACNRIASLYATQQPGKPAASTEQGK